MTDEEIERLIRKKLVVPLWPVAGRALGLKRWATYQAAEAGEIVTLDVSRKKNVPTSWLRKKLHLSKTA